MAFPAAKGQCLESLFSRCSDFSSEHMSFGEWKPLVNPASFCDSKCVLVGLPMVSSSPLWLAANFIEWRLKVPWATFPNVSPSPGGVDLLKEEYLFSDNKDPLVVLQSFSLCTFSLLESESSECTMTSASTWLLHRDEHRRSSKSCNKKVLDYVQIFFQKSCDKILFRLYFLNLFQDANIAQEERKLHKARNHSSNN